MRIIKALAIAGGISASMATFGSSAQAQGGVSVRVGPGGVGVQVGDEYRRGRHYRWGPGFYFHKGRYHGDCAWLRRRAVETGNRVWWRRFRQCKNH